MNRFNLNLPGIDSYHAGKGASGVYQKIINQIPPHLIYCEPFLGKGFIMRYKKPASETNIGCDLNKKLVYQWQRAIEEYEQLPIIHDFLTVREMDAFDFLKMMLENPVYTSIPDNVFIYLDPPYLVDSQKHQKQVYKHSFTREDHIRLLSLIVTMPFKIALSCYDNDLYASMLPGWRKIHFSAQTRRYTATETLYMNYPEPEALHDYSYLGGDFRERERIRKKITRHVQGLKRLPQLECAAIIEAITTKV